MEQTQIDQVEQTNVDNAIELKAMVNMLRRAEGFTLAFVQCNYPIDRINLVAELRQILDDYPIAEIEFDKPIENLLDELIPILPEYNNKALFIYGLERSINPDNKSHIMVANLNISRNLFPKYVSCPMIIWLPAYAISAILRGAPDFFSWRSAIFSFYSHPDKISAISQNILAGDHYASASLTLKEKEERIEAIKNLIDEYQSLPSSKTNKREQGRLFDRLAMIYYSLGDLDKSIKYSQQALELDREIDDKELEGFDLANIGLAYRHLGQTEKAIENYQFALEIARGIGNRRRSEGTILGNLGLIYSDLGQVEKAIDYYHQALNLARVTGNLESEGSCLNNLGMSYIHFGQVEKAMDYYQQALRIASSIGDKKLWSEILMNLGNAYLRLNQIDKALEFHQQSLRIAGDIGHKRLETNVLRNIGVDYAYLGQLDKALEYFQQALMADKEMGDRKGKGSDLRNLGLAYANLGQIDKAIEYYQQALVIAREIKDPRLESFVLENLEKLKQEKQSS